MVNCPEVILSTVIVTETGQLIGDNEETTPGSVVNLRCASSYELVGASKLICQASGKWDQDKPTCKVPGLNNDTQLNTIIIAVCATLSFLVLISLLIIVIVYFKKKKRLEREDGKKLNKYHDGEGGDDESTNADAHWAPRSSRSPYYIESYNRDNKYGYGGPKSHTSRSSWSKPPPYDDKSEMSYHSGGVAKKWQPSYGGRGPIDSRRMSYEEDYGASFNRSYDTPQRADNTRVKSPYGRSIRDEYATDMANFSRHPQPTPQREYETTNRDMYDPFSRSYAGSSMPRAQVHEYRSSDRRSNRY